MSVKKQWKINDARKLYSDRISDIASKLNISYLTATLMYNRSMTTPALAEAFLQRKSECFHDPFKLTDMDAAVNRLIAAIKGNERIVIFGDYDVDGVTAVSSLYLYLSSKGADVEYYIPNRIGEGYGLNTAAIDRFCKNGIKLVITVDTGITAVKEAEYAKTVGIDMIVTDHHECHDIIPSACAVVNPHRPDCSYPFKELAGVGVVFKFICAIEQRLCPDDTRYLNRICAEYGDMVAIGTVADVMPLIDENRLIVSVGLRSIERGSRPGVVALIDAAAGEKKNQKSSNKKKRVTSSLIGYTIAPRINAAGRMGSASLAVELFLTNDKAHAGRIASELCEANKERQVTENQIVEQAYEKIETECDLSNDRIIVLDSDEWHHGVIGIVSSRITERYNMPSIMISFRDSVGDGDDAVGKGSGRSIKGINLVGLLSECSEYLEKFGGHELAAGLSVKRGKINAFRKALNACIENRLPDGNPPVQFEADTEVEADEINLKNAEELYLLEPYGVANPVPVLLLCDAVIMDVQQIGGDRHTKLMLSKDGLSLQAVYFGVKASELQVYRGDLIDVYFNMDINDFQNVQSVQLIVRDLAPARTVQLERDEMHILYDRIVSGERIAECEKIIPSRVDFTAVYTYLRRESIRGDSIVNLYQLQNHTCGNGIYGYAKLRCVLDIFEETGIITISDIFEAESENSYIGLERKGEMVKITVNRVGEKINLEKSEIYRRLLSQCDTE